MGAEKGELADENGQYTVEGDPDRELAMQVVFGPAYHQAKAAIMAPIDEFLTMVDDRTALEVSRVQSLGRTQVNIALSIVLLSLVVTFVDPAIPASVPGDRVRLRQVLLQPGDNAVKFTDGGQVAIRAVQAESAGGYKTSVRYELADTGIGIDDETIEMLFDPFTRAESSRLRGGDDG